MRSIGEVGTRKLVIDIDDFVPEIFDRGTFPPDMEHAALGGVASPTCGWDGTIDYVKVGGAFIPAR